MNSDLSSISGHALCAIKQAMRELNVSRSELASRLGVTPSAVTQMLSGNENITLGRLDKVAKALGIRLSLYPLNPSESRSRAITEHRKVMGTVTVNVLPSHGNASLKTVARKLHPAFTA